MHRCVLGVCGLLLASAMLAGCQNPPHADPPPGGKGPGWTGNEQQIVDLLHLHALKDLQESAQVWASMGAVGGDQEKLRLALRLLDDARKAWSTAKCSDLVATLLSATEQALLAAEKVTNPEDKERQIYCLGKLRDELRGCNSDTLCIGKALMNYLMCIHGFKGPTAPQSGGTMSAPARRAR